MLRPVASLLLGLLGPIRVYRGDARVGLNATSALDRYGTLNTGRICIAAAIIQSRPLLRGVG